MSQHQHTQSCQDLLGSLSDYVDGNLKDELCREIERHVAECEDCRVVVDTMKKTIYLYHATAAESGMPQDVRERLYQRLDLDDFLKS
jgi:anti-sigma factor (TIGR02949 family)